MPKPNTTCSYCFVGVYKRPCILKSYKNSFCSREHQILYQKNKAFSIKCIVCGKERKTQPAQVKYRKARFCSKKCKGVYFTKQAEIKNKESPPSVGVLNRRIRYSKKMDDWRKKIFERDDYTCQICQQRGGKLNADHIKPFALFPQLRFKLSNGRTLCEPCHRNTETWGRSPIYR